ncbi:WXG100 family type VII secretion target [Streptomyces sp. NPDC020800]|uniref:WXG100 family type VII secretion target n=1 Tax=Streptomyces sp. NPDC020800 TaxID=3365092 RepID=UPI0037AAD4AC
MGDSWVGGDIGGLRTMAETYKNAKDKLDGVVKPLGGAVDKLVGDAGWQGEAAESFRAKWSEDALAAGGFAELVHAAGEILETLADALSTCNTSLQNAQHIAAGKGVATDPEGAPLPVMTANPPSADDQKTISAMNEYNTARNEVLHTAQHARLVAAQQLQGLYDKVTSKDGSVSPGDKVTLYDALRGLYAYDAEDARAGGIEARKHIDTARAEAQDAKKQLRAERKVFQQQGRKMPDDLPAKSAYRDAVTKVDSLEEDIARADNGSTKLPYDRALNVKLADAADALRLGKGLEALPDVLKELPVVDVVAAGACGLLEASDDHDKGWSWQHSVAVDEGANLGGLAAGAAITAGLVATAPIDLTAGAVAAVGVGAVIVSTSVIDHAFHEHWSEDIHDHGVVGGVLTGAGHVATETVDDGKRLVKDVWHGVTSIF